MVDVGKLISLRNPLVRKVIKTEELLVLQEMVDGKHRIQKRISFNLMST